MNTLLHALESYTELYKVSKDSKVKERWNGCSWMYLHKVYNPEERSVLFDMIIVLVCGHDLHHGDPGRNTVLQISLRSRYMNRFKFSSDRKYP